MLSLQVGNGSEPRHEENLVRLDTFAFSLIICLGLADIAGAPISLAVLLLPMVAFVQRL